MESALQPDFSELGAGFHVAQRGLGLVKWKHPVHHRHDLVGLDEAGHAGEIRRRAHGRAEDVDLPEETLAQVEPRRIAGRGAEKDDAAAGPRKLDEAGKAGATGAVDDDIEESARLLLPRAAPVAIAVVDATRGAKGFGASEFFRRT